MVLEIHIPSTKIVVVFKCASRCQNHLSVTTTNLEILNMDIIGQNFGGQVFHQRLSDGYINATLLCRVYNELKGKRRDAAEWLSNKRTQETFEYVSSYTEIPAFELVQVFQGSPENGGGTWLHPDLSVIFGMWLSNEFGTAVTKCVREWSQNQGFSSISEHVISVTTQAIIDNEATGTMKLGKHENAKR